MTTHQFFGIVVALAVLAAPAAATDPPTTARPSQSPSRSPQPSSSPSDVPSVAPSFHLAEGDILHQGLALFTNKFAGLDQLDVLSTPIPLVGLSINNILGDIYTTLDFTTFIMDGTRDFTADQIEGSINTFLTNRIAAGSVLSTYRDGASPLCPNTNNNQPIFVDWVDEATVGHTKLEITFCMEISKTKQFNFEPTGLFDSIPESILMETSAQLTAEATFTVASKLTVYFDGTTPGLVTAPEFEFELADAELNVNAGSANGLKLFLGVVELSSDATINLGASFSFCYDDPNVSGTPCSNDRLDSTDLYLTINSGYTVNGDLTLESAGVLPSLAALLPTPLSFTVTAQDTLSDYTPDFSSNLDPALEEALVAYSPKSMLQLIDRMESVVFRMMENEPFLKTSVPLTDKTLTKVLRKKNVFTTHKHLLAIPQPIATRPKKSRTIFSSKAFAAAPIGTLPKTLALIYTTGPDLNANPTDKAAINGLSNTKVCSFDIAADPATAAEFVSAIKTGVNAANCGVTLCEMGDTAATGCTRHNTNGARSTFDVSGSCSSTCKVVIGVDTDSNGNDKLYMTSVVDTSNSLDVVYLSLNEPDDRKGPDSLLGFPINQPAYPELVPRYNDIATFVATLSGGVQGSQEFNNVVIGFVFVPADANNLARFELTADFAQDTSVNAVWAPPGGNIGDFANVALEQANFVVDTTATFSTGFGVLLGPDTTEKLVILGTACKGEDPKTFSCDLAFTQLKLTYDSVEKVVDLPAGNGDAATALQVALDGVDALGSDFASVTTFGSNKFKIEFNAAFGSVQLQVLKTCKDAVDGTERAGSVFACATGDVPADSSNSYGLTDQVKSKRGFQVAVDQTTLSASFSVNGIAKLTAELNDVIEISADMTGQLSGSLTLTVGEVGYTPFFTWVADLIQLDHFNGLASFSGSFLADVHALEPFDAEILGATGAMAQYDIDFFANPGLPSITFQIDLPGIRDVRFLKYEDVVSCMAFTKSFLGSVETCAGGLLDFEINDQNVFFSKIPILGVRPCEKISLLSVYTDFVDYITAEFDDGVNTTFTALKEKLEGALSDVVESTGGTATVLFDTGETNDGLAVRSTLTIDIVLEWDLSFLDDLGFSLSELLDDIGVSGDDLSGAITGLLGDVVPEEGLALIPFDGVLRFQTGLGLERTVELPSANVPAGSEFLGTSCFMLGTSGLNLGFSGGTGGSAIGFDGMLGPFAGTFGIEFDFLDNLGSTDGDGLSLQIGFPDTSFNFYIDGDIPARLEGPSFPRVTDVDDLLARLSGSWTGGAGGGFTGSIPTIDVDLSLVMSFPNLETLFQNPTIAIFDLLDPGSISGSSNPLDFGGVLNFEVKSLGSDILQRLTSLDVPGLGDLMLGGGAFTNIVKSVENFFEKLDSLTFGASGIVTSIDIPFLKKKLAVALGAGSGGTSGASVFKKAGAKIAGALDDALDTLVGELGGTIAVEVANLLNEVLADILCPDQEVESICGCSDGDGTFLPNCPCEDNDGSIESIEWKIPLGASALNFEIPLDFELDGDLALDLNFTAELEVGWSFLLGLGYDVEQGLFIDTFPGESSEVSIQAALTVPNTGIEASLLNFLNASLTDATVQIAAGFFIDFDKEAGLRLKNPEVEGSRSYGRMTLSNFKGISLDFFQPSVRTAATFSTSMELSVGEAVVGDAAAYIPSLQADVKAVLFKNFEPDSDEGSGSSNGANTRRQLHERLEERRLQRLSQDFESFGRLTSQEHPARQLVEAIRHLVRNDILEEDFDFVEGGFCAVDTTQEEGGCLEVQALAVNTKKLKEQIDPFIEFFVTGDVDGALDNIAQPLLPLNDPVPGVSEVVGEDTSILDFAEQDSRFRAGAQALKKFIEVYLSIKDFAAKFEENDGVVTIADTCDVLAGFKCSGAMFGELEEEGRQLEVTADAHEIFALASKEGLPISPADHALRRQLDSSCDTDGSTCTDGTFGGDCSTASCCATTSCKKNEKVKKAKCLKEKIKCKASGIDGLTFPFLEDPTLMIGIITGDDFGLLRYEPDPLEFGMALEFSFTLYTPPFVELTLGLEFGATLTYGVELDTKGIREAVTQNEPLKALNSFAFIDVFDEVDVPTLVITGAVSVGVNVNAIFLEIGLTATVGFEATVDIWDPFPETSNGLVRPYELVVYQGLNPLDWLEFTLSMYFELEMYIRVQIWLIFTTITIYEISYSIREDIIAPILIEPLPVVPVVEVKDGDLTLNEDASGGLECFSLEGSLGEETVECILATSGQEKFATAEGVAEITFTNTRRNREMLSMVRRDGTVSGRMMTSTSDLFFKGIQSPIKLGSVGKLTLDYLASGSKVLGNAQIALAATSIQAGIANTHFLGISNKVVMELPFPEIQDLTTTLNDCNNQFDLIGHTNLIINADSIGTACSIKATGGENEASVLVDFGVSDSCMDGNSVKVSTSGEQTTIEIFRARDSFRKTFSFGTAFQIFEFLMSECQDTITIEKTLATTISIKVDGRKGDDIISIGHGQDGVNLIFGDLDVTGSAGSDKLIVLDTPSISLGYKNETMTSKFLEGFLPGENSLFEYEGFETITLYLTSSENSLLVASTPLDSSTFIFGGSSPSHFLVNSTKGDIEIQGGQSNDVFSVRQLFEGTTAVFKGLDGDDILNVDGRPFNSTELGSTVENTLIRWSGGNGNDTLNTYFVSYGDSTIELFDDNDGTNRINIDCADFACHILSRNNFLANIHDTESSSSTVERINLYQSTEMPVSVSAIVLRLNGGLNRMFFDDTMAKFDVFGGPDRDEFRIGQKYNSERGEMTGVVETLETTLTTQGYLSDGNSDNVVINGMGGGDFFDVIRNKKLLDLNGDSGDDTFIIRSFLALRLIEGEVQESDIGDVKAVGGDDNDLFEVGDTVTSYVVNAGVDIDGGTGDDRAVVVGTEAADTYVITDGEIFGGGLSIKFSNIELLDVTGQEGDDIFQILSTNPNVITSVYGSLGSDTFLVAPREVLPVISKNTKGHSGVLEHEIASGDEGYNGLLVEGIAVNVMDNDDFGYIHVIETSASYVLFEVSETEDVNGEGLSFDFYLYPTIRPDAKVVVDVQSQFSLNLEPYVILTDISDGSGTPDVDGVLELTWIAGNMAPKRIRAQHNYRAEPLEITDYNGLIAVDLIVQRTDDARFSDTNQTIQPIFNKLIPRKTPVAGRTDIAQSVTIIEPTGETVVAEGGTNGFEAAYDVYLRPCTASMKTNTKVEVSETVLDQVMVSPSTIVGNDWGADCKVTVSVAAKEDELEEGLHFVTLAHKVTTPAGEGILLSDGEPLVASNVLVKIQDDDIAGVILEQSNGATSTAEIDDVDKLLVETSGSDFSFYFEDSYRIRLSKAPNDTVTIQIYGVETASDDANQLGGLVDNSEIILRTTPRIQAYVRTTTAGTPASSVALEFTSLNWNLWQTVYVSAVNDGITEGVDLLNFPSQPSFLSYIQGPLVLAGSDSPDVPPIEPPLMLPGETDVDKFEIPDGYEADLSSFDAIEADSVNHLIIQNLDVRGSLKSIGTLTHDQFFGMNMGQNLVISGNAQRDGIVYRDMNLVELFLGNGADDITIESTAEALYLLHTGADDDDVHVKNISGPVLIQGAEGADKVRISSDSHKIDDILALLAFDGGSSDQDADRLAVDHSGDDIGSDPVLNITRNLVELASMSVSDETNAPRDSFLISLWGATGGSYELVLSDPLQASNEPKTIVVPLATTASELEDLIQDTIFPSGSEKACGKIGTTICSQSVKVYELGSGFLITFVGERLNRGVSLDFSPGTLESFQSEIFLNATNDILDQASDIVYGNVELLDIALGTKETVLNIRGTSAKTEIVTQNSDDYVFVSSDSNETPETAQVTDFLHGWLDYVTRDLTIVVNEGRHRLMISDESSSLPMASVDAPAGLTGSSLKGIKEGLGDIYFSADGGHWSAGVNLWLGKNDDYLSVTSIPANAEGTDLRTATSIHAGAGSDKITVALDESQLYGAVFVANGQAGNDIIDGSASSLPLILFGDDGLDEIKGGSGSDIVFGDYGVVEWIDSNSTVVASAGKGGYGDFTDGVVRHVSRVLSTGADQGDSDILILNGGNDIGIGGFKNDSVHGGDGMDIILGDSGRIEFYHDSLSPKLILPLDCEYGGPDTLYGGNGEVDYIIGGGFSDVIYGGTDVLDAADGSDLVFGDHAEIMLEEEPAYKLIRAEITLPECTGGDDSIYLGAGDDIAFGGAGNDYIEGNAGQDIIFGDFGIYDATISYPEYTSLIDHAEFAGNDTIHGGDHDDILFGQEGSDTIFGDGGNDDITGGHDVLFGEDAGDNLHGGSESDRLIGDNGRILRTGTRIAASTFPWLHNFVWETFPSPFDTDVIREVRLFDDVDKIQGDDKMWGDAGNDILWGQRGNDELNGGEGEDELIGGLHADILRGDAGNDILIGDVGHVIRRFDESGAPRLNSDSSGTSSEFVWHKDIVLEEIGNIVSSHLISKKVDTDILQAEDTVAASMLLVANAYSDGNKVNDASRGGWPTELILFNLEPGYDDVLEGGAGDDVVIGQRGDDTIKGGTGNDLLIGDSGSNKIGYNMDLPKIYEIYRSLTAPEQFEVPEFGAVFSVDMKLYPDQYREVDSLGSFVDGAVNIDDLQVDANLLHDILGVSALSKADPSECVQPMFAAMPGFLESTQHYHGNDSIDSGSGQSIVVGDDIRGFIGLDFEQFSDIDLVRKRTDELVASLGTRLSVMEFDAERSGLINGADYSIAVGCDSITTDATGQTFATGDSLNLIGRTYLAESVDSASLASIAEQVLDRLHDIELVLVDLHLALYELHHDLLVRSPQPSPTLPQEALHNLTLASDSISSFGTDVVVGDSVTYFVQADRPGTDGFAFGELKSDQAIESALSAIRNNREAALDAHETTDLTPTTPLGNSALNSLPFDDIPFLLYCGVDKIFLNTGTNLGIGDFALIGHVVTTQDSTTADLSAYTDSVEDLRKRPVVSIQVRLDVFGYDIEFYAERYNSAIAKDVKPVLHGDFFFGDSATNVALGEYWTSFGYDQPSGTFVHEDRADAFGQWDNARWNKIAGDTFDMIDGTKVDTQKGQDEVIGNLNTNDKLEAEMLFFTQGLLQGHVLLSQFATDLFNGVIPDNKLTMVKSKQCADMNMASYIPPFVYDPGSSTTTSGPSVSLASQTSTATLEFGAVPTVPTAASPSNNAPTSAPTSATTSAPTSAPTSPPVNSSPGNANGNGNGNGSANGKGKNKRARLRRRE
ncbi:Kringle domain [Seminavis robusta]|uniref:Kringle domain n=1 Tax=Seminavis robusta TaxID=568900 RepID=A0A9N8H816_9STRA|nr:Kringle domain [Seminavis robusta]|eukprot:Sro222_g091140.1 Kringle domain (5229) ;mRNA; r:7247-24037